MCTQYVGNSPYACPLEESDPTKLKLGDKYYVGARKEEAGMLFLQILDEKGKELDWYPAQWFNPTCRVAPIVIPT